MGCTMKKNNAHKIIAISLTLALVFQLTGCGTIFYPERKGQQSGEIDPIVAIADAVGLLFFFVPGVIAFAVDFSNGTIYKGRDKHSSLSPEELKSVTLNGKINVQALNKVMGEKLGVAVDVQASNVQVKKFDSENSMLAYFSVMQLQIAKL